MIGAIFHGEVVVCWVDDNCRIDKLKKKKNNLRKEQEAFLSKSKERICSNPTLEKKRKEEETLLFGCSGSG